METLKISLLERIPLKVQRVIETLNEHGFKAYLVGGCVRDLLLNLPPKDYDVGTSATPEQVLKIFPRSRLIGRRFPIVHVYIAPGEVVEVSTFRGREELDGVIQENYGTPHEDAQRRDLTINSLFYDVKSQLVIDYTGGLKDLERGIIRVIGDPLLRFKQDPVRMLRVIRHASRLSFKILPEVWEAISLRKQLIKGVAKERLRDELLKDIESSYVTSWFYLLKKTQLLYEIYPFLRRLEKKRAISYSLINNLLKEMEELNASREEKVCVFLYGFLGVIRRSPFPEDWRKTPSFEREKLLKLFWAFFFTFRFCRAFFEECMDIFRDAAKLVYILYYRYDISRKYKRKKHYASSLKVAKSILKCLKRVGRNGFKEL